MAVREASVVIDQESTRMGTVAHCTLVTSFHCWCRNSCCCALLSAAELSALRNTATPVTPL